MPISTKTTKAPEKVPLCVELPGLEPRTTEPKSAVLPLHHSSIRCSKATAKVAKKSEFAKTTPQNRDFAFEFNLFSHCARL